MVKLHATYPRVWRTMLPRGAYVIVRRGNKSSRVATIRTRFLDGAVVEYLTGGFGTYKRRSMRKPDEKEIARIEQDRKATDGAKAHFNGKALDDLKNQLHLDFKSIK